MAAFALPLISAGVGLFGSLFGANKQAQAARDAAAAQQAAAAAAGKKVEDAATAVNPQITEAAATGAQQSNEAAATAAANANTAAQQAGAGVTGAAGQANSLLDPYAAAGADASNLLRAGIAEGGTFNKPFTAADFQVDPGYQFRLDQGNLALQRKLGAPGGGGTMGGAAAKAALTYNSGLASQEFQNAFDRFRTSTQDRFGNLMGVSNAGQAAAGTQGSNLVGAAKYTGDTGINATQFGGKLTTDAAQFGAGLNFSGATTTAGNTLGAAKSAADYLTQGANANAAGKVGSANAWASGLSGAANAVTGAAGIYNLLKNPASTVTGGMPPGYRQPSVYDMGYPRRNP